MGDHCGVSCYSRYRVDDPRGLLEFALKLPGLVSFGRYRIAPSRTAVGSSPVSRNDRPGRIPLCDAFSVADPFGVRDRGTLISRGTIGSESASRSEQPQEGAQSGVFGGNAADKSVACVYIDCSYISDSAKTRISPLSIPVPAILVTTAVLVSLVLYRYNQHCSHTLFLSINSQDNYIALYSPPQEASSVMELVVLPSDTITVASRIPVIILLFFIFSI